MPSKPRAIHHVHERTVHNAELSSRARHGLRRERQPRQRLNLRFLIRIWMMLLAC